MTSMMAPSFRIQTALRVFLLLSWLSFIADAVLTVLLHNSLPPALKDWRTTESSEVVNAIGAVVFLASVVASFGLFRLRRWGAWTYLICVVSAYALMPFYGPVVSHGVAGAVNGVFGCFTGATLAVAFFTNALRRER